MGLLGDGLVRLDRRGADGLLRADLHLRGRQTAKGEVA